MTSECDTFIAIKYGIFTAEDIKQRWLTKDSSKFTSLPNEIKIRWIELLRDRYLNEVDVDMRDRFISVVNNYIFQARNGDFTYFSYFFSFFPSFINSNPSFFAYTYYPEKFTDEIMDKLAIDAGILNKIIREYV
jgi:hypothetical protein